MAAVASPRLVILYPAHDTLAVGAPRSLRAYPEAVYSESAASLVRTSSPLTAAPAFLSIYPLKSMTFEPWVKVMTASWSSYSYRSPAVICIEQLALPSIEVI